VERYQGRLLAFARSRLANKADADDLVQDTFISFLQGLKSFRDEASVETYLFTILRRRAIDLYRSRRNVVCSLQDTFDDSRPDAAGELPGREQTASWYVRKDEGSQKLRDGLATALSTLIERLKSEENFRDLQIVEMLFYAQLRNKDAAVVAGIDEKHVALIKHRCLNEIRAKVPAGLPLESLGESGSLLTEVWEQQRFSCPKRSTIGRYLLGTLEEPWYTHVAFHVTRLGCRFCGANLDDLKTQAAQTPQVVHERVMQSTAGFFKG
jgi:RNA polymerase sigma factor (sigma-70 family)